MRIDSIRGMAILLLALVSFADEPPQPPAPVRVGAGVTPPKLKYKVEPDYSAEGLDAGIQGTVMVDLIVSETGQAVNLSVVSPLGFGLDEKAMEAIEKWRFEPGRKDGKPVPVVATVEVNFRLSGRAFDSKAEARRTSFNVAVTELRTQQGKRLESAVKTIQDLAKQNFPPAWYALGKLLAAGDSVPADPERAAALIQKAADKNYGPALFDVGLKYYQGNQLPKDTEKGLKLMRDGAVLGSAQAQFYLGDLYEKGVEMPAEPDRARRYFGLCAATGQAACQVRLAKLLLGLPHRQEHEYVQAVAWLELAANQANAEARDLAAKEASQLTPQQMSQVRKLMPQLIHQ